MRAAYRRLGALVRDQARHGSTACGPSPWTPPRDVGGQDLGDRAEAAQERRTAPTAGSAQWWGSRRGPVGVSSPCESSSQRPSGVSRALPGPGPERLPRLGHWTEASLISQPLTTLAARPRMGRGPRHRCRPVQPSTRCSREPVGLARRSFRRLSCVAARARRYSSGASWRTPRATWSLAEAPRVCPARGSEGGRVGCGAVQLVRSWSAWVVSEPGSAL